jgi:hypothetical protein
VRRDDNLATFMYLFSENPGSLNLLEPSGPVQACPGIVLPITFATLRIVCLLIYLYKQGVSREIIWLKNNHLKHLIEYFYKICVF